MVNINKKIVLRDNARCGKKYDNALRGYQKRIDILEAMCEPIDIKKEIKIADLGCGPGTVGLYLYQKLKKYNSPIMTFIDINNLMLRAIHRKTNFRIINKNLVNLNIGKDLFDVVVMKQVLDYLTEEMQIKVLKNIHKILKPHGQFILSFLIPPNEESFKLTNYLYSEREKIIHPSAPIKKFIPTKKILFDWLNKIGFNEIKTHYVYDIPLSTKDFAHSFGLNKKQEQNLKKLYQDIIYKDKSKNFMSKLEKEDIELIEKGMIISCYKN